MRLGLIVPSSNTVVESDFLSLRRSWSSVHTARMFLRTVNAESERIMLRKHLPGAIRDIASIEPSVVAFACTSAGALLGEAGEERLILDLEAATGAPAVSTNAAVKRAIAQHRPGRVAVLTPYLDHLTEAVASGIENDGWKVVEARGLGLIDNVDIGRIPPRDIEAFARNALSRTAFDLLFISCTNLRAMEVRASLTRLFGVPVVTSNQATIDAVCEVVSSGARGTMRRTARPLVGQTDTMSDEPRALGRSDLLVAE